MAGGQPTLVHVGDPDRGERWRTYLPALVPELAVRQWPDVGELRDVRYVAAWNPPPALFQGLVNLEIIFSVGAGIDHFDSAQLPPGVPLVRMVEPRLTEEMVEYAVFAVLALHRDMLRYVADQAHARWAPRANVAAAARRVGILGLGEIGSAVARRIAALGFPVAGWSRTPRAIDGVACHAGAGALEGFLAGTDILICVLPLTAETRHVIDARLLRALPPGAGIVNIGRGGHLDETALLAAIDAGHISGAVLDVAAQEPPPPDHRFWRDPRILLTPHIAGITDIDGGARAIADNILRHRAGRPLVGAVDAARGY